MKTTIVEQINAIRSVRKSFAQRAGRFAAEQNLPLSKFTKMDRALNDAASTLAAVNFIGPEMILIAPELVQEVKKFLTHWEAGKNWGQVSPHLEKMKAIINRLPK